MFDLGVVQNMYEYQQPTPPQYSLANVKVPIALFYGVNDFLADPLVRLLKKKKKKKKNSNT